MPLAIYLPSRIAGGSKTDADMLKMLWNALGSIGTCVFLGADDGIRTRDPHLGKVVLYH